MNTPWKWVAGPVYNDDGVLAAPVDWDYRGYGYNPCLVDSNGEKVVHAGNGEYSPCTKEVGEKLLRAINAHEDLLNAARQALSDLEWVEKLDAGSNFKSSILLLRRAITKATEE